MPSSPAPPKIKDPQILLNRIKSEFPHVSWRHHRFLNHGWDHDVIILDNQLVFRFPNSAEYLRLFRDELDLLAFLAGKISLPLPRYQYIAHDRSFGGYEIVPGTELKEELFASLSEQDQHTITRQLGEFITTLHTIPLQDLTPFNVPTEDAVKDLTELRANAQKYLPAALSEVEYHLVIHTLEELELITSKPLPQTFTHNDLSSSHIIWDAARHGIGVIDLSDRVITDPAVDFAELFFFGASFVEEVYSHYGGPKDPGLLARARLYLKRIGVYMMIDVFENPDKVTPAEGKMYFDRVFKNL